MVTIKGLKVFYEEDIIENIIIYIGNVDLDITELVYAVLVHLQLQELPKSSGDYEVIVDEGVPRKMYYNATAKSFGYNLVKF